MALPIDQVIKLCKMHIINCSSSAVEFFTVQPWYVYFTVKSLIKIFVDKISRMAYNEASFQLKMMVSSEFPCTKFSLLIDHPRIARKFHTAKISGYTVLHNFNQLTIQCQFPVSLRSSDNA